MDYDEAKEVVGMSKRVMRFAYKKGLIRGALFSSMIWLFIYYLISK